MGAIWCGHGGRVPPLFPVGGYNMPYPSTFFSSGFVFGEVPKISDICHVLCEVLFMLDVTHSQVDVETEFGVVSLNSVCLSILASIK